VDIENKKNKVMDGSTSVNKAADSPTTIKAVSQLINEYFFPGDGVWKSMTVEAPNIEQAEEIYKAMREPVNPVKEPEKVEAEKESNNE